jgi:16S rRNA processing protein RimM
MAKKGFVPVGKVIKTHGLKGELCIAWYADSPFLCESLPRIYLKAEGRHPRQQRILNLRPHTKGQLVRLDSIPGRDVARQWIGAEVWVRRRDVPDWAQKALRRLEFLGLAVYLQSGEYLGRIDSVDGQTGQEIWTIRTCVDQEILLPAVPEFVCRVEPDQGMAVVSPPPGLLELYGFFEHNSNQQEEDKE